MTCSPCAAGASRRSPSPQAAPMKPDRTASDQTPPAGPPYAIPVAPLTAFYAQPPDGVVGSGSGGSGDESDLKIVDLFSGEPISDAGAPVVKVVGQEVKLAVQGDVPEGAVIQWFIPFRRLGGKSGLVRDYSLKSSSRWYGTATVTPFKTGHSRQAVVNFYWTHTLAASDRTVRVVVRKGDDYVCEASADFEVQRPDVLRWGGTAAPESAIRKSGNNLAPLVNYGRPPGTPGIRVTADVGAPGGFGGEFGLIQRITLAQGYEIPADAGPPAGCYQFDRRSFPHGSKYVLDRNHEDNPPKIPFYNSRILSLGGGGRGRLRVADSPQWPVKSNAADRAWGRQEFEVFLLYKPTQEYDGEDNIFVTLAKRKWGWSATMNSETDSFGGNSFPNPPDNRVVDPVLTGESVQLPEWRARIQDLNVDGSYRLLPNCDAAGRVD